MTIMTMSAQPCMLHRLLKKARLLLRQAAYSGILSGCLLKKACSVRGHRGSTLLSAAVLCSLSVQCCAVFSVCLLSSALPRCECCLRLRLPQAQAAQAASFRLCCIKLLHQAAAAAAAAQPEVELPTLRLAGSSTSWRRLGRRAAALPLPASSSRTGQLL